MIPTTACQNGLCLQGSAKMNKNAVLCMPDKWMVISLSKETLHVCVWSQVCRMLITWSACVTGGINLLIAGETLISMCGSKKSQSCMPPLVFWVYSQYTCIDGTTVYCTFPVFCIWWFSAEQWTGWNKKH